MTFEFVRHANCGKAVQFVRQKLHPLDEYPGVVLVCPDHGAIHNTNDLDPPGAVCVVTLNGGRDVGGD